MDKELITALNRFLDSFENTLQDTSQAAYIQLGRDYSQLNEVMKKLGARSREPYWITERRNYENLESLES